MTGLYNNLLNYAESVIPNVGRATTIAIIASIALALFYCFFGYKLLRLHISFILFMIGAVIGLAIGVNFNVNNNLMLALIFVPAVLLAIFGFFFYKAGVFAIVFTLVLFASYAFLGDIVKAPYIIFVCIAAAVLFGILACFFVRPVTIVMTALSGALIVSDTLIDRFLTQVALLNSPRVTEYIVLGFAAILAIFGMIFQFRTTENYEEKRTRRRR